MRSIARVVAALALLLLAPCEARAGWMQLQSQNFLFVGDAPERTIRATAQKVEQFREAMLRAIPGARAISPVPTIVIVFGSDASFSPYKPRFEGRAVDAAGLFLQNDDINYILVNAEALDQAFKIVFHEYSHFLIGNWSEAAPVWINEGIAEVYSTFEERDGGKSAVLGLAQGNHVGLLQTTRLIPLRELIAVETSSPTYNEGSRRGVLYAESWALVHYLMFGADVRRPQLQKFLTAIKAGTQPEQAFGDAFGDTAALERELRAYLRQWRFRGVRVDFGEKVGGGAPARGEPIADAQASAYLGDVLARLGRADAARAQLGPLLEKDGSLARTACVLGLIELRERRYDQALPLLERAAALAPDDAWIQTALGDALIVRSEADGPGDVDALRERARVALARVADRSDASARTLATFGRAHLFDGGDPQRAVSSLERALTLVPGREEYRVLLGHAFLLQHEYVRATTQLGPLVARASHPQVRDYARRLLAAVSRAQLAEESVARALAASAEPPDEPPSPAAETSRPPDRPERADSATLDARAGSAERRREARLGLREVRTGETRVLGIFTAAECGPDGIVLRIESDRRVLRLAARGFDEVDFISHRKNGPGGVACGEQSPLFPVLATFRAAEKRGGVDGMAIAIEVVEDDFLPR